MKLMFKQTLGRSLWEKCMEAGEEFNITPYGTETMHLLRAEKGFIIVGQDTDGNNDTNRFTDGLDCK